MSSPSPSSSSSTTTIASTPSTSSTTTKKTKTALLISSPAPPPTTQQQLLHHNHQHQQHRTTNAPPQLYIETTSGTHGNQIQLLKLQKQQQQLRRKNSKNSPVRPSSSRSKKKYYYSLDPRVRFSSQTNISNSSQNNNSSSNRKLQSSLTNNNNNNSYWLTSHQHINNNNTIKSRLSQSHDGELDAFSDDNSSTSLSLMDDEMIGLDHLPDELLMVIFRFLPIVDLARCSRVCRRFVVLWFQCAHTVQVQGKLRRMKEDEFVQVIRKFVRLESLDLCNTGSSEDFQLTDKGLLQLAHKYIYSNADYLCVPNRDDPLTGSYDFNFDYESHLDSLDELTGSFTGDTIYEDSDLDTLNDFTLVDEDEELSSESGCGLTVNGSFNSMTELTTTNTTNTFATAATPQSYSDMRSTAAQQRRLAAAAQKRVQLQKPNNNSNLQYNLQYYTHIYYVYPPPRQNQLPLKSGGGAEPHYGLHTLKSLNLLGCHHITENGIKYLTFFCQNLRDLNLKGCTKVNDSALIYLAQFEHLVNLDLTGCVHITDLGLRHLSNSKSKSSLQFLDLTFCHKITDEGLESISQLAALEALNLQCCRFVTNKGLSHIINACRDLKSLNLTGCDKATLTGIEAPEGLPKLERITMMGCKLTSDSCMTNLNNWTRNLKELILAFSDHITDQGIKTIVEGSPHLTALNLKRCDNITDQSLEHISEHLSDTLLQLNLTGCRQLTNRGLGYLTSLRRLQELQLRKCYQLDSEGLDYVKLCVYLVRLDISECTKITDRCLKQLCNTLCNPNRIQQEEEANSSNPNWTPHMKRTGLREIKVEKCPLLSKEVLDMLQMSYSHVSFVRGGDTRK